MTNLKKKIAFSILLSIVLLISGFARAQTGDSTHRSSPTVTDSTVPPKTPTDDATGLSKPRPVSLNDTLINELNNIDIYDQLYRNQIEETQQKYGGSSHEMTTLFKNMRIRDSLNLLQVTVLINKYGWPGADLVGRDGNTTVFMVIQHSDLPVQEKYLPLMQQAVKNGKAKASDLALLEDKVAAKEKKKQLYGSQIVWNIKTNEYYVFPLEDPDNVDKRRAEVGLPPLADYLMEHCHLVWDAEQYKKDLPKLMALQKIK